MEMLTCSKCGKKIELIAQHGDGFVCPSCHGVLKDAFGNPVSPDVVQRSKYDLLFLQLRETEKKLCDAEIEIEGLKSRLEDARKALKTERSNIATPTEETKEAIKTAIHNAACGITTESSLYHNTETAAAIKTLCECLDLISENRYCSAEWSAATSIALAEALKNEQ